MTDVTVIDTAHAGPLVAGLAWAAATSGAPANIRFSFPSSSSVWDFERAYADSETPTQNFASLSDPGAQQMFRQVLAAWASTAKLAFTEVSDDAGGSGDIRIAYTGSAMTPTQLAYAYLPNRLGNGGDIWLNQALRSDLLANFEPQSLAGYTLLHEAGHALGLKHPDEALETNAATLDVLTDTLFNTVMSRTVWPGVAASVAGNIDRYPSTPMALDIDAMRLMYGKRTDWNTGDDVYVFSGTGRYLQTLLDGGGNDSIRLDGDAGGEIDLRPGQWSQLGMAVQINSGRIVNPDTVFIYQDTLIENAIGGNGHDKLIGNALDNLLDGRGGNDTLNGNAGLDTALFHGPRANYLLSRTGNGYVISDTSGVEGLDTLSNVERLLFADHGVALDIDGNAGRTARILGAVFGPAGLQNKEYAGFGLRWLDAARPYQDLIQLALDTRLGPQPSHEDVVHLLYRNVVGNAPDAGELAAYVAMLDNGFHSPASLGLFAAETTANANQVDLVGLTLSGLAYL